jgi:hypothetical protein
VREADVSFDWGFQMKLLFRGGLVALVFLVTNGFVPLLPWGAAFVALLHIWRFGRCGDYFRQ